MTCRKDPKLQPGELPASVQMKLAVEDYNTMLAEKGQASIRDIVRRRGVPWETLRDRISLRTAKSKEEEAQAQRRLTVAEEEVLEEYCLQLEK
jgi:hypothetical protein